jgi:hypothetical protein
LDETHAFKRRCYLVYAIAPEATSAREANEALSVYIEGPHRGVVVLYDNFARAPRGGVAVFDVRSEDELAMLRDLGPLADWDVRIHALRSSHSAIGFAKQMDFTLREYGGTSLEAMEASDEDNPRAWWRRRRRP